MAYFEPRDITENAIVLNGLAWDIRNGRRTFEGYLFDSTSPISQEDREQFIDSLITKLFAETLGLIERDAPSFWRVINHTRYPWNSTSFRV